MDARERLTQDFKDCSLLFKMARTSFDAGRKTFTAEMLRQVSRRVLEMANRVDPDTAQGGE